MAMMLFRLVPETLFWYEFSGTRTNDLSPKQREGHLTLRLAASLLGLGYGNDSGQMTPHFIVKLIEGLAERFGT